jgi:hypothetical protein
MVEAVLFLYLFQSHAPGTLFPPVNPKSPETVQRMPDFRPAGETSSSPSDGLKREADYEEHEFAKRFKRPDKRLVRLRLRLQCRPHNEYQEGEGHREGLAQVGKI